MTALLIDALSGFTGVTIRVRHPLPEASMRLMATLNATVLVDPSAPRCSGYREWDTKLGKRTSCPACAALEAERRPA